ncbi:MAG: ROK family protein [Sphingomonadaceae bacterium]|nr:ROK family protein [Sphingomonadaceae bacterium]NCA01703.1 ROK family protein [Sphingomonadaceae bacterium]
MRGGIEAGGTKFVLVTGTPDQTIVARHSIPTTSPAETLARAADWFRQQETVEAIGIASFGPVDINPASPTWGHIQQTPKPDWSHCDLAGFFARQFGVPIGFDTDVNAAAMAEAQNQLADTCLAYVTIGTGIGGGVVVKGAPVHGAAHPEMGHIYPRRPQNDRNFAGICPYHGDCLEGLASGPAIFARWGKNLSDLPPDHEARGLIAEYLAQLCHMIFATLSAHRVVLGGGVMQTPGLLELVRAQAARLDADYLPGRAQHQICRPVHGDNAGAIGALLLAEKALDQALASQSAKPLK